MNIMEGIGWVTVAVGGGFMMLDFGKWVWKKLSIRKWARKERKSVCVIINGKKTEYVATDILTIAADQEGTVYYDGAVRGERELLMLKWAMEAAKKRAEKKERDDD